MPRLGTRLLVGAGLLALACPAWPLPAPGDPAPRFALRQFRDKTVLVSSVGLLGGRTTLLSFFATWCKPCKEEIPELRRLAESYGRKGFRVVLVCLDRLGAHHVEEYLREARAGSLPVLWDKFGHTREAFGVVQLPANVLVGPDETVLDAWEGFQPDQLLALERRLSGLADDRQAAGDEGKP